MMNKLTVASVLLASLAFACSAPSTGDLATGEDRGASTRTPASTSEDGEDDAEDADGNDATNGANNPATPPPGDQNTPETAADDDGKPTEGEEGKAPDAVCMATCDALPSCEDHSFCEFLCTEGPSAADCLKAKTTCTKQDIVTCEKAAGIVFDDTSPKGGDTGTKEGGKPGGKKGAK